MALDPDLIDLWSVWVCVWMELVRQYPPPVLDADNRLSHSLMYGRVATEWYCRADTKVLLGGIVFWGEEGLESVVNGFRDIEQVVAASLRQSPTAESGKTTAFQLVILRNEGSLVQPHRSLDRDPSFLRMTKTGRCSP
jgi:hypothetical protein